MPPEINQPVTLSSEPVKVKKGFSASKQIVVESWRILQKDKEIIWFPFLSFVTTLVIFGGLSLAFFFGALNGNLSELENWSSGSMGWIDYLVILVLYVVSYFIVNFFQAGTMIIVDARVNGQDLNFKDGINGAVSNSGKIFAWSLISATVGVILGFLADRFKVVGRIINWVLGAAWAILTYFSLPSLIIGKNSVRNSFKESASLIRKTWGEVLIINFGVGLFFTVVILGVIMLGGIAVWLLPYFPFQVLIGLCVAIFTLSMIIVSSALGVIFKLALYEYARSGKIIEGFSPDLLANAIKAEKSPLK